MFNGRRRPRGIAERLRSNLTDGRPAGLLIALLLLAIVALTSFLSWQQYVRFANSTRYSNQAIGALNATLGSIREAESSERAYLLTGDRQYLAEYSSAVASTARGLRSLQERTAKAELQPMIRSFHEAVDDNLAGIASIADLAMRGETDSALALVKSDRVHQLMATTKARESQFEKQLQTSLVINRENSRFYARLSQYVSIFGSAGILVLVYLAHRRNLHLISSAALMNAQLTRVNADLQQFVFSASHDLQEPLRTLAIHSQLVAKRVREGRPFDQELGFIERAATLMTEIVHNLLLYTQAVSDKDNEEPRANLTEVVNSVCAVLQPVMDKLGAQITYDRLPVVPISKTHATIVIQNLLSNALKYHCNGHRPEVRILARREASNWILSVVDNGMGIDPAYHQQIFGLFKRLHAREEYPGTGLGLAICKKIIERYGGRISVESKVGEGATFLVSLPIG